MSRMYEQTKTWNLSLGCNYGCIYCVPSFQETIRNFEKLRGGKCEGCLTYAPHEHPERLRKIPSKPIVFVNGNGDISFARPEFVRQTILAIKNHLKRCPKKVFYFQSKNPICLKQYLGDLEPIRDSVVFLTTLETNRDDGYERISKAPVPSTRFRDYLGLPWKRKIPTIEPVMKFDLDLFVTWIKEIGPEAVYLGYNSRPSRVFLPEPTRTEFRELWQKLSKFTEVRLKETRGATCLP